MGALRSIVGRIRSSVSSTFRILLLGVFSAGGGNTSTYDSSKPVSSNVIMGPGGPGDRISTPYEHTVGLERLEYLARMSGRNFYMMEPLKIDQYGTLDNPVIVESMVGERIAGCTGFPKDSHEVVWMKVSGTKRCPECGQAFKIKKV